VWDRFFILFLFYFFLSQTCHVATTQSMINKVILNCDLALVFKFLYGLTYSQAGEAKGHIAFHSLPLFLYIATLTGGKKFNIFTEEGKCRKGSVLALLTMKYGGE
jgi:hypothetical protein